MLATPTIPEQKTDSLPASAAISLGGISVGVKGVPGASLGAALAPFLSSNDYCDIQISVDSAAEIQPLPCAASFDSGALWAMFRSDDHLVFDFTSPALGSTPYRRMQVNKSFTSAQITMRRNILSLHETVSPLEYPGDELLVTNYLAHHALGVEVHGCGLIDGEAGGQLFLGHSGAGKSTTARLWDYFRNPKILSDDRIILRFHDGELWMYGTPWHGEAEFAAPAKAKLRRIFVVQHGRHNEISPLTKAQTVGEMFARSFPPFHSAEGLGRTVEFLSGIADRLPCYEFQFVPDESAVKAALDFNG